MNADRLDSAILSFFREDIGGIVITGVNGEVIYEDEKSAFIRTEKTNWRFACPAPAEGQNGEMWDLLSSDSGKTYMVTTSSFTDEEGRKQIHHLVDTSLYMGLYREMTDYSKALKTEKDHDALTGLYNRGRFLEFKRDLFSKQDRIAVYNMDLNNLKKMNDLYGHEAGDKLIRKAAESLKLIESRNIMPFRVGGDEFITVAIHVNRDQAEQILQKWRDGLANLNLRDDGIYCEIACGFVYREGEFDLDEVFAEADRLMYEDKQAIKDASGEAPYR